MIITSWPHLRTQVGPVFITTNVRTVPHTYFPNTHRELVFLCYLFELYNHVHILTYDIVSASRFIQVVQDLQYKYVPSNTSQNLLFAFKNTAKAAEHNATVLRNYNYDINAAIMAQPNSQVSYGSEFKDPQLLHQLLQGHPYWPN